MDLSQEELAKKLDLAPMTLSRFERGVQVPRDVEVLARLRDAAIEANLPSDQMMFQGVILKILEQKSDYEVTVSARPVHTPESWQLMHAARIAALYFPNEAAAMRKAARMSLELVNEAIASVDFTVFDETVYVALEAKLDNLVTQWKFQQIKEQNQK